MTRHEDYALMTNEELAESATEVVDDITHRRGTMHGNLERLHAIQKVQDARKARKKAARERLQMEPPRGQQELPLRPIG